MYGKYMEVKSFKFWNNKALQLNVFQLLKFVYKSMYTFINRMPEKIVNKSDSKKMLTTITIGF